MATAATTMNAAAHDRFAGIFTQSKSSSASAPTSSSIGGTTTNDSVTNNSNNTMTMIVSPGFETQTLLSSIYAVPVDEIGSNKFMTAYCVNLERLSVQAHWTAGVIAASQMNTVAVNNNGNGEATSTMMATPGLGDVLSSLTGVGGIMGGSNDEEFIVEAFLENVDKLEALVKTLLALELWRENVLFDGWNRKKEDAVIEEDEVEFEVEGGERDEYNDLNEVDGGEEDAADTTNVEARRGLAWRLEDNGNALRTAFILHAETTIVSLLSLIFYKGIPAGLLEGSLGDEMLLSLIDYCARQLIFLGSPEESNPALSRQKNPLPAAQLSAYLQTRSRMDEIRDSVYDSTYQTAIASVPLSRYLCENVNDLGPSLLSRMLEMHDFPLLMVPLIEEPPWTRRRMIEKPGGGGHTTKMMWEKLDEHNEWKEVPPTNLLQLTKLEGQPWLALFHLTTSKVCREAYGLDEYRKSQLMRVRKYLHETLMDQLPVLGDVARYLDELSILGVPPSGQGIHRPSSSASSSGLLLQRVDVLRESIVGKRSMGDSEYWEGIAASQWESIFSCVTDSKDEELRRIAAEVYGGDVMEDDVVNASRFDLQKEEPQSADEDWKVALSKPIERVLLSIKDNSNNILASIELTPAQNGGAAATTETPLGTFQRLKMAISQTSGDGDAIFPLARAVACIQFQGEPSPTGPNNEVELCIDSLQLTAVEHSMSQNTYDEVGIALPENWPKKEWRQIGDLESKSVVLQLGFKRLSRGMVPAGSTLLRGYTLSQAFLSQPCAAS